MTGEGCPTYARLAGVSAPLSSYQQGKPDIYIPDWDGEVGLFDVGVTHYYHPNMSLHAEDSRASQNNTSATRMAQQKTKAFDENVKTQARGAGQMLIDSWRFVPLCVDTAGGWACEAIETINHCASRIDVSRRGHVVGIWWQLLSVALQREHERVLRWKV